MGAPSAPIDALQNGFLSELNILLYGNKKCFLRRCCGISFFHDYR